MKSKDRNDKKQWLIILSSFLTGSIITLIMVFFLTKTLNQTVVIKEPSVTDSLNKIYDATVFIESIDEAAGSGFFYKMDNKYAYILTNEHLINSSEVKVTNSKKKVTTGKVLGKDKYIDLAVVRVNRVYAPKLARFSKDKLELGESIYVVGTPLNKNFQGTVTSGIISGKDRLVRTSIDGGEDNWVMKVLQFDAAINSGNSGGPLVNMNGEVVGICTMKYMREDIEGMAFAIPMEDINKYKDLLEKGKEIERPDLGASTIDITKEASLYGRKITIPDNVDEGAVIIKTKNNSPAAKAKLQKGDIITEINGNKIKDSIYYKYELYKYKKGDKIKIKYIRNGHNRTVSVKL